MMPEMNAIHLLKCELLQVINDWNLAQHALEKQRDPTRKAILLHRCQKLEQRHQDLVAAYHWHQQFH